MATEVDQRVVRMQFDNAQFEQKMAKTMSSLQKFEKQLQLEGAEKGLQAVQKAADKVDMSHLANVADTVELKFSAMSAAVIHQVNRMVDAVVDAGVKMAKSLTVDQITSGFDKYTQKTAAVQTIMNATGKSVEDVNNALAKLQWFSDETSYSFVDMTNNVGKFTSAGVDLDVAVSAMQGIANAAADAGATSNEAARAMYNFSQALSKGYVQLIDWKSVENANMATITFKDTIVETAKELGTLKEAADGTLQTLNGNAVSATNFNDALKDGWFTNEVLLQSLSKYSAYSDAIYKVSDAFDTCADAMAATSEEGMELGARAFKAAQQAKTFTEAIDATKDAVSSGWMRTFEIIFGNFNESVELWTNFTNTLWDVFASGGESRNELLKGGLMSGWDKFVENGITDTERLKKTLIEIGGNGSVQFEKMIEGMGGFEKSLRSGWLTADILRQGILKIGDEIHKMDAAQLEAAGYTQASIESFLQLEYAVNTGTISLKEFAAEMAKPSGRENLITAISEAFKNLQSIVEPVRKAISEIFPPITVETLYKMTESIKNFTKQLKLSEGAAYTLQVAVKLLLLPIKAVFTLIQVGFAWATTLILILFKLGDAFLSLLANTNVLEVALRKIFGDDRYERIMTAWNKIASKLSYAFEHLGQYIMDGIGWLVNVGGPAALDILSKIYAFFKPAIDYILDGVVDIFEYLADFDFKQFWAAIQTGFRYILDTFPFIEVAFNKMASAVSSFFKWFEDKTILDVLDFLISRLQRAKDFIVYIFESIPWAKIWDVIVQGAKMAAEAIRVFSTYIADFIQKLTPAKVLTYAFGAALIFVLFSFTNVAKSASDLFYTLSDAVKTFTSKFVPAKYTAIAASILVLVGALIALAFIDPKRLWTAVSVLGLVAGGLLAFVVTLSGLAKWISASKESINGLNSLTISLIAISGSVLILAVAFNKLGSTENVGKAVGGLIAVVVAIIGITAVLGKLNKSHKQFDAGIKTMLATVASLWLMIQSVKTLMTFDTDAAIVAIVELLGVVAAINLLSSRASAVMADQNGAMISSKKAISGLISAAIGLLLFVQVLKSFANLDLETYLEGLAKIVPIMIVMKLLGTKTKEAGGEISGAGGYLLGMAAFMGIAAIVIGKIAGIPYGDILKGTIIITGLIILLTSSLKSLSVITEEGQQAGVVKRATSTLISLSIAVGLLSAVIWAVGNIDLGTVIQGTLVVAVLLKLLTNLLAATKEAGKVSGTLGTLTLVIASIATTIALFTLLDTKELLVSTIAMTLVFQSVAKALGEFSKIEVKKALVSALTLTVLLSVLTASFKWLDSSDYKTTIVSAVSLSGVVLALGAAIKLISGVDWSDAKKRIGEMVAFTVLAGVALMAMGQWNTAGIGQTIANAAALSMCVLAMSAAMKVMGSIKTDNTNTQKLTGSITGMAVLFVLAGLAIAGIAVATKESSVLKVIGVAAAIALTVLAIAESIKIMAEAKIQDRKAARLDQAISASVGILVLAAAAIGILVGAIPNGNDFKAVIAASAGISLAMLAIAEAVKMIATIDVKETDMKDYLKLVATIGLFLVEVGGALAIMAKFEIENALPNAIALSTVLMAISTAVRIMGGVKVDDNIMSLGFSLLLIMGGIALVFAVMGTMDYEQANANVLSLIGILGTITLMTVIFNKLDMSLKDSFTGAASFDIVLAMVVGIIGLIGGIVNEYEGAREAIDSGIEVISSLTGIIPMLLTLLGMTVILAGVGKLLGGAGGSASAGAGGGIAFAEVIAIITAVITALGAIYSIEGVDKLVSNGVEFFEKLGEAIGGFIGAMVGAFTGNLLGSTLAGLGAGIGSFTKSVGSSLEILSSDKMTKAMTNIGGLAEALIKITAANILDGINKLLGGRKGKKSPLKEFGKQIKTLGPHLNTFLNSFAGTESVNDDVIDSAIKAAEALSGVASGLYKDGGKWQDFAGHTTSLEDFGAMLPGFAEDMLAFYTTLRGTGENADFDADFVKQSASAAEALAAVANGLYKDDGKWQDWTGHTTTLLEFGAMLADPTGATLGFADYMLKYYQILSQGNFDSAFVTQSANAAEALSEVANGLHKEGGLVGLITGEQINLVDFGKGIEQMGLGMLSFNNSMEAIKSENLDNGLSAIEKFNEIASTLGADDDLWDKIIGTDTKSIMKSFGQGINSIGVKLESFYNHIAAIDATKMDAAMKSVSGMFDIFVGLVGDGSQVDSYNLGMFNSFLTDLGNAPLDKISDAFKNYDVSGFVTGLITRISTQLQSETCKNILTTGVGNLFTYISDNVSMNFVTSEGITTAMSDALNQAFTDSGVSENIKTMVGLIVDSFSSEIDEKFSAATDTIATSFEVIPASAEKKFDISNGTSKRFQTMGEYVLTGLLNGIRDAKLVASSINLLVNTLSSETTKALKIVNKSSEVYQEFGKYILQGIADGVKENQKIGDTAMKNLCKALLEVAQKELEIASPSKVFRDEVGRWIVEGVVEGLSDSKNAEEAAQKLAQNITSAFSEALNGLDIIDTKEDLEYQIWETLNPDATQGEKDLKKAEMLESQIQRQAERVSAANAEWQAMVQFFGEDSTDAQEAYNRYLQAQLDMAQIASDISSLRTDSLEDAQNAVNEYWSKSENDIDAFYAEGHTAQEAWEKAAKEMGYDVNKLNNAKAGTFTPSEIFSKNMARDVEVSFDKPIEEIKDYVANSFQNAVADALSNPDESVVSAALADAGLDTSIAGDIAKTLDGVDLAEYAKSLDFSNLGVEMPDMVDEAKQQAEDLQNMFSGGMSFWLDGVVDGLASLIAKTGLIGKDSAKRFLDFFCEKLGINSPSTVMAEQGQYMNEGLAEGILTTWQPVKNAVVWLAGAMVNWFGNELLPKIKDMTANFTSSIGYVISQSITEINEIFNGMEPFVIKPVLDLSEVEAGLSTLSNFQITTTAATNVQAVDQQITATKKAKSSAASNQNGSTTGNVTNYTFNQTNNSPKALNPSEVYRKTKNLFTTLQFVEDNPDDTQKVKL